MWQEPNAVAQRATLFIHDANVCNWNKLVMGYDMCTLTAGARIAIDRAACARVLHAIQLCIVSIVSDRAT